MPEFTGCRLIIGAGGRNICDTPALVLKGNIFVEAQRAANGGAGGNRLTIGKSGGVAHLLAGFIGLGLGQVTVGAGILQYRLSVGQANDTAGRINFADTRRAGNRARGEGQQGGDKNEAFHHVALRNLS